MQLSIQFYSKSTLIVTIATIYLIILRWSQRLQLMCFFTKHLFLLLLSPGVRNSMTHLTILISEIDQPSIRIGQKIWQVIRPTSFQKLIRISFFLGFSYSFSIHLKPRSDEPCWTYLPQPCSTNVKRLLYEFGFSMYL